VGLRRLRLHRAARRKAEENRASRSSNCCIVLLTASPNREREKETCRENFPPLDPVDGHGNRQLPGTPFIASQRWCCCGVPRRSEGHVSFNGEFAALLPWIDRRMRGRHGWRVTFHPLHDDEPRTAYRRTITASRAKLHPDVDVRPISLHWKNQSPPLLRQSWDGPPNGGASLVEVVRNPPPAIPIRSDCLL
jgi:hypothetical protein